MDIILSNVGHTFTIFWKYLDHILALSCPNFGIKEPLKAKKRPFLNLVKKGGGSQSPFQSIWDPNHHVKIPLNPSCGIKKTSLASENSLKEEDAPRIEKHYM